MLDTPFVSIILPVYNAQSCLTKCLYSLCAQDYPPESFEIIVIDNMSTDQSRAIAAGYPKVRLLEEKRFQNSYAARNQGIRQAQGELIAFIDADCIAYPDWLSRGVAALYEQGADLVGGNVEPIFRDKRSIVELYDALMTFPMGLTIGLGSCPTLNLFVKRELFDRLGLFRNDVECEDNRWTRSATLAGYRLVYAPEARVKHPVRNLNEFIHKTFRYASGKLPYFKAIGLSHMEIARQVVFLFLPRKPSTIKLHIDYFNAKEAEEKLWQLVGFSFVQAFFQGAGFLVSLFKPKKPAVSQADLCFLVPALSGGGAESLVFLMTKYLAQRQHEIALILFKLHEGEREELLKQQSNMALYDMNYTFFSRYDIPNPLKLLKLRGIIVQANPKLIVTHTAFPSLLILALKALKLTSLPVVVWIHSNLCLAFRQDRIGALKLWIIKYMYRKADRVVTVSHALEKAMQDFLGAEESRFKTIYNPIDLEHINGLKRASVADSDNNLPVIISVGRLTDQKDYLTAFKAIARIKDFISCYWVLGEGHMEDVLKEAARSLGLTEKVKFLGYQDNPFAYLAKADCFLLSSQYEGFGNVIVEAMACGVPVVSTRAPYGPEEIITDGENGLLVPVGDDQSIADAILRVLQDKELKERLIEKGNERAQDFDINRIIPQYEQLFDEVINKQ